MATRSLDFTDRPFVLDNERGTTMPVNGFRRTGAGYTVSDAWAAEPDMEKYIVTPDDFLRLKSCFDKINRKSKAHEPDAGVRAEKERIRATFNRSYMRLKQLAIGTRYRYNLRRYINTPPIRQCTYQYDCVLRRICRLDNMRPDVLQTKKIFIQRDKRWSGGGGGGGGGGKHRAAFATNESLQRLWRAMNDTDLVNKSIRDQTQGGKSFLKQVVIPGKMLHSLYGKVLPDPELEPDEIGLPGHVMESVFKGVNMNKTAAIVKRDPVFSSDAITTFTRVKRTPYQYITLPSEIITNKQLDFDGDTVSVVMVKSPRCFIETLMRLSPKITMYCPFYRTRLSFSQTTPFRVAGLLEHERGAARLLGDTFAYAAAYDRVSDRLRETLLSLSQQYGPGVAYGFVMKARACALDGFNRYRIYPIGPDPRRQSLHIAASGSKGTVDGVNDMFAGPGAGREATGDEALEYAKVFIEVKTLIRKQGHNAKKMDSAFQNVIVDHNDRLTMKVNDVIHDLGHVTNFIQREWIMSDLTVNCLLDDVVEKGPEPAAEDWDWERLGV